MVCKAGQLYHPPLDFVPMSAPARRVVARCITEPIHAPSKTAAKSKTEVDAITLLTDDHKK